MKFSSSQWPTDDRVAIREWSVDLNLLNQDFLVARTRYSLRRELRTILRKLSGFAYRREVRAQDPTVGDDTDATACR